MRHAHFRFVDFSARLAEGAKSLSGKENIAGTDRVDHPVRAAKQ